MNFFHFIQTNLLLVKNRTGYLLNKSIAFTQAIKLKLRIQATTFITYLHHTTHRLSNLLSDALKQFFSLVQNLITNWVTFLTNAPAAIASMVLGKLEIYYLCLIRSISDTYKGLIANIRYFKQRYLMMSIAPSSRFFLTNVAIGAVFLFSLIGYFIGTKVNHSLEYSTWQQDISSRYARVISMSQVELDLLSSKLGLLEARLARMDVLGRRLVEAHNLDENEFNFLHNPGFGGIDQRGHTLSAKQLVFTLDKLDNDLDETELQIQLMADLIDRSGLKKQMLPVGWPVEKGFISSRFGYRVSPFSGQREYHSGVDFSSEKGTSIIANASGVVKFSRLLKDYGNLIDIDHGDGLITRYAHNQLNLVREGDLVKKGDIIALVGSTGRSTGPHLHFEVIKYGHKLDPDKYLSQHH